MDDFFVMARGIIYASNEEQFESTHHLIALKWRIGHKDASPVNSDFCVPGVYGMCIG